ncbi:hypothetical protein P1X15_20650 [Runella sp. MFBS21]|uniref:hypothetical protein n=1 Tax=Runella sp. MFBS21 TaxID=3034018 RepID=UPI0023F7F888|nr:hypothetical protein [Runella sp. MFBS21]MDF7820043.1 hypothetical protein [Runella sp. MFBS21]
MKRILTGILFFIFSQIGYAQSWIDLTQASVNRRQADANEFKEIVTVLQEEIATRSGVLPKISSNFEGSSEASIYLILEKNITELPSALRAEVLRLPLPTREGFRLVASAEKNAVVVVGKDVRGVMYGVGRLLRKAEITKGRVRFPSDFRISTSPKYLVRGHQLGYRPKTNSYDAFTVAQYDQYIRELALFGANSIEILPPGTDDEPTSRHMKLATLDMVKEQARICQRYGLDVWMWYPNIGKDFTTPEKVKNELLARETVFKAVSKIDAIFVPGGDPGELEPDELFEWMDKVAVLLKKYHPKAKIWISPQSFKPTKAWFDSFFRHVNKGYPWLGGVVYGPWVKVPIDQIRKIVKPSIPIRNYPDITHSIASQYPEPDWDPAWAVTLGREAVNPRPKDQKFFHNIVAPYCIGSISYSEGTNDDVNKFVWSDQDWDPKTDVRETLKDYSRLFFDADLAMDGALGLSELETNIKGPILAANQIERTLMRWQKMEQSASKTLLANPRFQMGLIRAYFDAYVRERSIYETQLERQAYEILTSGEGNSQAKAQKAMEVLSKAWQEPVAVSLRERCLALADSLHRSIGAQLTVVKHGAMQGRGNFIDNLDYPLNDAPWLMRELKKVEKMDDTQAKQALARLLGRTYPGKGGIYDHFMNPTSRARVVPTKYNWNNDPESLQSSRIGYGMNLPKDYLESFPRMSTPVPAVPRAWTSQIEVLYDNVLKIKYDELEKGVQYKVKVVYSGRFKSNVRMMTSDGILIHDYIKLGEQPEYEFEVPAQAIKNGEVIFQWNCKEAERGLQVAEVSLIRAE